MKGRGAGQASGGRAAERRARGRLLHRGGAGPCQGPAGRVEAAAGSGGWDYFRPIASQAALYWPAQIWAAV